LVANVAEVAKELVIVRLAVGKPLLLVVSVTHEGLLAFGADEMLKEATQNDGFNFHAFTPSQIDIDDKRVDY
jgi:hypothetical protein